MKLNELKFTDGAKHSKKRIGRGTGSGTGETAGRGMHGQNSRSGGGVRIGFEGGQNPLYRRLPKRGFSNHNFKKVFSIVNIEQLNKFKDGETITPELLVSSGLVKKELDGIKILGNGSLERKLIIKANKFSKSAVQAIENSGGSYEVL